MGGLSVIAPPARDTASPQHRRARRAFLVSNYLILGCASGCGFLTLSLRLVPSVDGFLLILLHALTVAAAIAGCAVIAAPDPPRGRCYTAHMSATVVVSILQGAAAVLAFSRTADFLSDGLKSYVREEDGAVILRMVGGLGVAIFCLEWAQVLLLRRQGVRRQSAAPQRQGRRRGRRGNLAMALPGLKRRESAAFASRSQEDELRTVSSWNSVECCSTDRTTTKCVGMG